MVNGQVCQGVRQVPIDIIYVGFNPTTQLTTTIQKKCKIVTFFLITQHIDLFYLKVQRLSLDNQMRLLGKNKSKQSLSVEILCVG